jgi:hypothetical protein
MARRICLPTALLPLLALPSPSPAVPLTPSRPTAPPAVVAQLRYDPLTDLAVFPSSRACDEALEWGLRELDRLEFERRLDPRHSHEWGEVYAETVRRLMAWAALRDARATGWDDWSRCPCERLYLRVGAGWARPPNWWEGRSGYPGDEPYRLEALARLRNVLGPADYWAGRMPPPCVVEAYRPLD